METVSALQYTLRPVEAGDARAIYEMRRMEGTYENMMGLPSNSLSRSEQFVANIGPNSHQFVAVLQGDEGGERVIGLAGFHVNEGARNRHIGSIGIMVHPDYQGKGVGTALMKQLLDLADNWLMLVRLELTVFTVNPDAKRLYERLGFQEEGILHKGAVRQGEYADLYSMARIHPKYR